MQKGKTNFRYFVLEEGEGKELSCVAFGQLADDISLCFEAGALSFDLFITKKNGEAVIQKCLTARYTVEEPGRKYRIKVPPSDLDIIEDVIPPTKILLALKKIGILSWADVFENADNRAKWLDLKKRMLDYCMQKQKGTSRSGALRASNAEGRFRLDTD